MPHCHIMSCIRHTDLVCLIIKMFEVTNGQSDHYESTFFLSVPCLLIVGTFRSLGAKSYAGSDDEVLVLLSHGVNSWNEITIIPWVHAIVWLSKPVQTEITCVLSNHVGEYIQRRYHDLFQPVTQAARPLFVEMAAFSTLTSACITVSQPSCIITVGIHARQVSSPSNYRYSLSNFIVNEWHHMRHWCRAK